MSDPENFVEQERGEARDARMFAGRNPLTGLFDAPERELRDPWSGVWRPVPSRAELEERGA